MADITRSTLMRKIQELSFAKVECELFLDTHPDNVGAIEYYNKILAELDEAMTKYQNEYAPIFAEGTVGKRWSWVDDKWPWHTEWEMKGEDR